ncbi:MAG: hypothetical protein OSB45_05325 [Pseudomonadales bacterium]|nr:hypothetical protein [Pseudomonadales bacterium]
MRIENILPFLAPVARYLAHHKALNDLTPCEVSIIPDKPVFFSDLRRLALSHNLHLLAVLLTLGNIDDKHRLQTLRSYHRRCLGQVRLADTTPLLVTIV